MALPKCQSLFFTNAIPAWLPEIKFCLLSDSLASFEVGSPEPSEGRTFRVVFGIPKVANHQLSTRIYKHQYRNPIFLAQEWQRDLVDRIYNSRSDLSCKMRVSRARVTQILNLLKLPEDVVQKVSAIGDPMPGPVSTERGLRSLLSQ